MDTSRFQGTCYKACGFQAVGSSAGFARASRECYLGHGQPLLAPGPWASEGLRGEGTQGKRHPRGSHAQRGGPGAETGPAKGHPARRRTSKGSKPSHPPGALPPPQTR